MNLVELFEKYQYICCDDREEEYEFYKEVYDYGLRISDNINHEFIDELMSGREFSLPFDYPIVYAIGVL